MKLLLVTLATCLALHSACSQAGLVNNGAMDGGVCGVSSCVSTDGCPLVKNKLLKTFSELNKEFRVSFEFKATTYVNGWQSVIHFTKGGDCCNVGERIPALFVYNFGNLYPTFALNGNGNWYTTTGKNYPVNKWHHVEFSQSLENSKFIYRVKINGDNVIEIENNKPQKFSNVKVYAADNYFQSLKGSVRNLFVNTVGSYKCSGMPLEDSQNLFEIMTNLTRVQQAEIEVLQRLQQHQMEYNKEKLAAKDTIIDLHVAENAKLSDILKETQEFCNLRSISSELEAVSNPGKLWCDVGEVYNDNCYLLVSTPATWQDAQLDCTNRNGSLATIQDAGTNNFIAKLAGGGHSSTWIDGSDAETEGEWKFANGGISKYSNWDYGEPNNRGGNQDCLVINYLETGKWDDSWCDRLYPYVCQGQKLSKGCESGWKQHGDNGFKVFPEVLVSFFDASEKCRSVQAQVASVGTEDKNAFIKVLLEQEQLPSGRDVWLSGRKQSEDSPYVWNTGEEMAYSDWSPAAIPGLCMDMFKNDNIHWQWSGEECWNRGDNCVLCEKPAH